MLEVINWFLESKLVLLLNKFPLRFRNIMVYFIGYSIYLRQSNTRKVIKENFLKSFSIRKNMPIANDIDKKVIINYCKYLFDIALLGCSDGKEKSGLLPSAKINVHGFENFEESLSKNLGTILVSLDFGNYIFGILYLLNKGYTNIKILGNKEYGNLAINKRIVKYLKKSGIDIGFLSDRITDYQFLKQNGVLLLFVDSFEKSRLVKVNFLGRPSFISGYVIFLSLLTGASILPFFIWQENDYCQMIIEKKLGLSITKNKKCDISINLLKLLGIAEIYIECHPEQWFGWVNSKDIWFDNELLKERQIEQKKQQARTYSRDILWVLENKLNCENNETYLFEMVSKGFSLVDDPENIFLKKDFEKKFNVFLEKLKK